MAFLDHLQDAIEKQIVDVNVKETLILQMARDNVNEERRKAIDLLPMKKPSLHDMINACAKIGTAPHQMAMLTESVSTVVAAAIKVTHHCYTCGQLGHLESQCPHRTLSSGAINNKAAPGATLCNRCGKPGHYVKQCKSHFHDNGQPLKNQGNSRGWQMQKYFPKNCCAQHRFV